MHHQAASQDAALLRLVLRRILQSRRREAAGALDGRGGRRGVRHALRLPLPRRLRHVGGGL